MRGLAEIREINEEPRRARKDDALFAGRHASLRGEAQRFHGERVEARQAERMEANQPKRGEMDVLTDLLINAVVESILLPPKSSPMIADRAGQSFNQPAFLDFWDRLNAERARDGRDEALYGEAKSLFAGGKPPVGAMAFIGKQWDGLRAVPAEEVKELGGARPAYHGEYREITRGRVVWHKVVNGNDLPIRYKIPEAAICGAEHQRNERVAKQFR